MHLYWGREGGVVSLVSLVTSISLAVYVLGSLPGKTLLSFFQ